MAHKHFLKKFAEKMDDSVNILWLKWLIYNKNNLNDQLVIKKYSKD